MNADSNQPNDDILRQLSEYVDGTLDPKAAIELMQKVAVDLSLQKELAALRAADELIKSNQDEIPEIDWESFSNSVRKRIGKRDRSDNHSRKIFRFQKWQPLAAAAVVAISVTAFLLVQKPESTPQSLLSGANVDSGKVSISVARPHHDASNSTAMAGVVATVSRTRPSGAAIYEGPEFMGPPYHEKTILVSTSLN
ncbi:MAG: hypothetical protein DHS20C16_24400 [Phycisphaerae bacterium]|nr:MAG: hypothetical protein DHS20C16_24400 [Phycisphaerae bacterium]